LRPLANNLISRFMQEVGPLTREQTPALAETPGGRIPAVSIQQAAGATGSTQTITCLPPETLIRQVSRQFTIRVSQSDQTDRIGLVAGYPRLEEFCRDACVSVPGLLLEFGRYEEARELLLRLALLRREGALPSHWCEDPDAHEYVNADTALWFIWAVDHYLHRITASDESSIELLKASSDIVEALMDGRREGIHLDDDGLLVSDDVLTASTWMDARHAWKFSTPRLGKPVEVNALWYNALCVLAERLDDTQPQAAGRFREAARRVLENFQKLYWNPTVRGLYDVIGPNGPDPAIRPNQILAVSVRHSPLDQEHQAAVVRLVQERLLTPMGLRTLSSDDPNYHGAYEGTIEQRERAAHQGSVYAWLLGPFVEAYLRVHGDSAETRATAREFVLHVMGHLTGSGCIVGINELFDGNAPHRPRGCITQAWSVAEIARAWAMTSPLDRPVPWTSIEPSDPSNHMDETSQTGRGHPAAVPFRTADRVLRKPR
jgi:glycogen debranching enzyme